MCLYSVERSTGGLEVTGSINPFVKGLFFTKAIATQAHPRNENTIVAAQQAVKPEIAKRRMDMFVVNMMPEFCRRYSEGLEGGLGGSV
jgi:chitin synthase